MLLQVDLYFENSLIIGLQN